MLVVLFEEFMTAAVDTIFGERHGAFGRTEEIIEMIFEKVHSGCCGPLRL